MNYRRIDAAAFFLLIGFLLTNTALLCLHEGWIGDFWIYLGLLDQVSVNPWNPHHIGFDNTNSLHDFVPYWPYLAALAALRRLGDLDYLTVFKVASLLNIFFFAFALRRFAKTNLGTTDFVGTILFCLLFVNGASPWMFSGFLHFDVFFLTTSYPSFFALSLSLLTLSFPLCSLRKFRYASFMIGSRCAVVVPRRTAASMASSSGLARTRASTAFWTSRGSRNQFSFAF